MAHFSAVSDEDLARARRDPAFRRKLLSESLEVLLATLNKMRASSRSLDKASARQIRDGVDLAVKLAELLQSATHQNEPPKAA
jgi:hypothetical protein